jgi:DNA repair exonuclease SbcCD ATPase subunit
LFFLLVTQLETQWKDNTKKVIDRKDTLETMLSECRKLEQINYEFTNRITEMEEKIMNLPSIGNGVETLKKQKIEYKEVRSEINQLKGLFEELKDITQAIIYKYQSDDISKIRIRYERLVTRFNELSLM